MTSVALFGPLHYAVRKEPPKNTRHWPTYTMLGPGASILGTVLRSECVEHILAEAGGIRVPYLIGYHRGALKSIPSKWGR